MERILGPYSSYIYALMRIVVGFLFLQHGTQKLLGFPSNGKARMALGVDLMTIGGVIELVGGALILIGLFASIAAFIASGMMAVAYFMFHQPGGALPIQNGGETAVLYCFIFLYIASVGSGVLSVDSMIRRGRT